MIEQLRSTIDVLEITLAVRDAKIERLRTALGQIAEWSRAYPLKVFPEPDWAHVRKLLEAGGITLDAVSASNMRHVVEQVGVLAREALEPTPGRKTG
jgi:hypothetical protein